MSTCRALALAAVLTLSLGGAALAESADVVRAQALLEKGKVEEAVSALEAAVARDQGDIDALIMLSVIYQRSGLADQGLAQAQAAVRAAPRHQEALLTRGLAWEAKGDLEKAKADYDAALAIGPYAPAFHNRGVLASQAGDHERAIADYRAAMAADPQAAADSAVGLGIALAALDRTDEALKAYDQALSIDPTNYDALAYKIDLLEELERWDAAEAVYRAALKAYPKDALLLATYGGHWRKREAPEKALRALDQALRLDPEMWRAWWSRGRVLRDLGKHKQAMESLDRALVLAPAEAEILVDRAILRWDVGDERALADFDAALKINPKSIYGLNARGSYLMTTKDYDRALTDFDAVVGLDPHMRFAYTARADIYRLQEHYDRALREINRALQYDRNADGLRRKGEIYRDMGDHLQSIEAYDEAIKLAPGDAYAWVGRARTKAAMGDTAGAEADRKQALKLDPSVGS